MRTINTYTLKQYKECYPDLLERHKLEYEDHNEYTFINTELESFYDGFIEIEDIEELPFQFQFLKSFTDEELSDALLSQREFKDFAIKSNLSSSMIIGFLEQRKQELEKELNTVSQPVFSSETIPPVMQTAENTLFKASFEFKNNFDNVHKNDVYEYFEKELLDKKYLTKEKLEEYLVFAFQNKKAPEVKFTFDKIKTQRAIIRIFYNYYLTKAQKPYGEKTAYVELLTNYFNGFDTIKIESNFSK